MDVALRLAAEEREHVPPLPQGNRDEPRGSRHRLVRLRVLGRERVGHHWALGQHGDRRADSVARWHGALGAFLVANAQVHAVTRDHLAKHRHGIVHDPGELGRPVERCDKLGAPQAQRDLALEARDPPRRLESSGQEPRYHLELAPDGPRDVARAAM